MLFYTVCFVYWLACIELRQKHIGLVMLFFERQHQASYGTSFVSNIRSKYNWFGAVRLFSFKHLALRQLVYRVQLTGPEHWLDQTVAVNIMPTVAVPSYDRHEGVISRESYRLCRKGHSSMTLGLIRRLARQGKARQKPTYLSWSAPCKWDK